MDLLGLRASRGYLGALACLDIQDILDLRENMEIKDCLDLLHLLMGKGCLSKVPPETQGLVAYQVLLVTRDHQGSQDHLDPQGPRPPSQVDQGGTGSQVPLALKERKGTQDALPMALRGAQGP